MIYLVYLIAGYLSGSVMYACLLSKCLKHIDIRQLSKDGNPGAANAFIHAGIPMGIIVLLCELCKGAVPVWLASQYLDTNNLLFSLVFIAPVAGHAYPLFSKGKDGGKAIAVSFGVLLGLFPELAPVLILSILYLLFSIIIIISPHLFRSITVFTLFAIGIQFIGTLPVPIRLGCFLISLIVIIKHFVSYQGEQPALSVPWIRFRKNE